MTLLSFLLREKPAKTLILLRDKSKKWYPSLLAKEVDCTYPHMIKILKVFEKYGLIVSRREGRTRYVELTDTGEELAHDLEGVFRRIEKIESSA